ncbi:MULTISPECIES: hypothetical protein [unclassified Methylobacterium]|jgi:hypothetical protein|uniref:hypothetical protein n=1 Tax=unclassified Methylobacterium TaxID=2615210 RepID=UPI0013546475|nr:hypothetical protein [Methylobacterium sp. 2A]MWV21734.1 hypothetical protein [Methylobacterium sp. 2A]
MLAEALRAMASAEEQARRRSALFRLATPHPSIAPGRAAFAKVAAFGASVAVGRLGIAGAD